MLENEKYFKINQCFLTTFKASLTYRTTKFDTYHNSIKIFGFFRLKSIKNILPSKECIYYDLDNRWEQSDITFCHAWTFFLFFLCVKSWEALCYYQVFIKKFFGERWIQIYKQTCQRVKMIFNKIKSKKCKFVKQ